MFPLKTFYRLPVVVYEPHAENVLQCPTETLYRIRDDAALVQRRYRDEVFADRVLRRHLGEEMRILDENVGEECGKLRDRVDEAEALLRGAPAVAVQTEDVRRLDVTPVASVDTPVIVREDPPVEEQSFGIAQCDPKIRYSTDFRGEVIATMFGNAQTWTFSFGSWYYRLKRWLFVQPQWKRIYRLSQIDNFTISQELLTAVVSAVERVTVYPTFDCAMSDVEAAACILAAYDASLDRPERVNFESVHDVLLETPRIVRALSEDVNVELAKRAGGPAANFFKYNDPPDMKFYAPSQNGRHYAPHTFDDHALVDVLLRRRVLVRLPGHRATGDASVSERVTGQAKDDLLFIWTRRLLSKKLNGVDVPVMVHEQQYLRSGLTAISSLLLLYRVVNAESVFGKRRGSFSLVDILGTSLDRGGVACDDRDYDEPGYVSQNVKNFEYLLVNYVMPWYRADPNVTVSQLFPGLVLICTADSARSGWDPGLRNDTRQTASDDTRVIAVQSNKANPVADYMFLQSSRQGDETKRLQAHDLVQFHYENGLGRMLSVTLARHRLLTLATSLFNVNDVYEALYFFTFGFLPVMVVS
ncbi:B77 [miniopterid betaherpesvirus 1]|uniref:B77 n=1 Tax=miniopterid betaherpesvirus 1 TaxID=3070189 RepID=I3VQ71_9BETA|nr:B77 [miniopterid betaherpesvirus 1]AFK83915.1 B77 [miniopterid betaherpesvirus 1]